MTDPSSPQSTLEDALTHHLTNSSKKLQDHHPQAVSLFEKKGITPAKIREHAARLLTTGTLTASLVLASPMVSHLRPTTTMELARLSVSERQQDFAQQFTSGLTHNNWHLTPDQELRIENLIREYWGMDAHAELAGHRLNNVYGLMGAEQHLPRYPGDTIFNHDEIQESGITPATGAWSFFSNSQQDLNPEDILREKYYVAVQTLYLPDWNTHTTELKDWYKYRKVVVINPKNGKTIVCDIADAGPALSTGKHFGGSPEVMHYLDLDKGMKKGEVILFFLDEHETPVPLGPVEYNQRIGRI